VAVRKADPPNTEASHRLGVNFQVARHRIEELTGYSAITRARALAAYVGVFDFADASGFVDVSSEEISAQFEISRVAWLQYRRLLEEAGLIEVDERRGGTRRGLRLLPPSADVSNAVAGAPAGRGTAPSTRRKA
jgi:hypothetical protein